MKKVIYFSVFNLILLFAISCGTKKTAAQLSEQKRILVEKIENQQFKFIANYAIPRGNFQPRYLTSVYDVKVNRDTVYSHLPYFGVAYQAPWNPSESPLIFNSTRFDYTVREGNKRGSWIVNISIHDRMNPMMYIFTIWDNGSGDLVVWDSSRQSISFRGDVELTP